MRKKLVSTLLMLCIGTSFLAGCANLKGNITNIVSGKDRKTVKIVSDIDKDYLKKYLDVFTDKHPEVKIKVEVDTSKNVLNKLERDKDKTDIDILFSYSLMNTEKLDEEGLLQPYTPKEPDDIKNLYKSKGDSPTWIALGSYSPIIVYNKSTLDKEKLPAPTKFSDLAKDIYDGYFVLPDLDKTPMGKLIGSAVEKEVGKDKSDEILKKLRSNSYSNEMYYSKITSYLSKDKIPIVILRDFEGLSKEWNNDDLKVIYSNKDTIVDDKKTVALVNKKEINDDAKVLMDWILSEQSIGLYKDMISQEGIKNLKEAMETEKEKQKENIAARQDKKVVRILTDISGDYLQEYFDVFTSKHPNISVAGVEIDTSKNILNRIKRDGENSDIDIVLSYSMLNTLQLDKEGLLLPYKSEELDNIKELYKSGEDTTRWSALSAYTPVIAYNKDMLNKEKLPVPTKFSDLADDIYDGYFVIPDLDKTPMGKMIAKIIEKEVGMDKAEEVLRKLRSNSYASEMYYATTAAYLNEYKVPLAILPDFEGLFSQWDDTNMKVIYGTNDTLIGDMEVIALVNKKEVKGDAKVFVEWFLSEQAANLYKKNRSMISRKGIETIMEKAPEDLEKEVRFLDK